MKYLNLDTDSTLGGDNASDSVVSSQKAIRTFIMNMAFPSITVESDTNVRSPQRQHKSSPRVHFGHLINHVF